MIPILCFIGNIQIRKLSKPEFRYASSIYSMKINAAFDSVVLRLSAKVPREESADCSFRQTLLPLSFRLLRRRGLSLVFLLPRRIQRLPKGLRRIPAGSHFGDLFGVRGGAARKRRHFRDCEVPHCDGAGSAGSGFCAGQQG